MRILFAMDQRADRGSIQSISNYVRAGDEVFELCERAIERALRWPERKADVLAKARRAPVTARRCCRRRAPSWWMAAAISRTRLRSG